MFEKYQNGVGVLGVLCHDARAKTRLSQEGQSPIMASQERHKRRRAVAISGGQENGIRVVNPRILLGSSMASF